MSNLSRRRFVLATAACGTLSACSMESWNWEAPEKRGFAAFLPDGPDYDAQAIRAGLLRIQERLGTTVQIQSYAEQTALREAVRGVAATPVSMVLGYGPEAATVLREAGVEFPAQRFSVIQTSATAAHLASYSVAHEQSAWLAGAAAGMLSNQKAVGHVGSANDETQALARAAFSAGLHETAPKARFLTGFGADPARMAAAQIDAGAEIIFHTLPDDSPLRALAEQRRVPLIGRGADWLKKTQGVYLASAFADPGIAAFQAGQDAYDGLWRRGLQRRIGLTNPQAVRLVLAERVPPAIQQRVGLFQRELIAGGYRIAGHYDGPEFKL
jgi:basic membrane protein A and related proteins